MREEKGKVLKNIDFHEAENTLEPLALRMLAQRCQLSNPMERPSFQEISLILKVQLIL